MSSWPLTSSSMPAGSRPPIRSAPSRSAAAMRSGAPGLRRSRRFAGTRRAECRSRSREASRTRSTRFESGEADLRVDVDMAARARRAVDDRACGSAPRRALRSAVRHHGAGALGGDALAHAAPLRDGAGEGARMRLVEMDMTVDERRQRAARRQDRCSRSGGGAPPGAPARAMRPPAISTSAKPPFGQRALARIIDEGQALRRRILVEPVAIALEFLAGREDEAQIMLVVGRDRLALRSRANRAGASVAIPRALRARQVGKADLRHERRDRLPEIAQRRRRIGRARRDQPQPMAFRSPRAARKNRASRRRAQAKAARLGHASADRSPACRRRAEFRLCAIARMKCQSRSSSVSTCRNAAGPYMKARTSAGSSVDGLRRSRTPERKIGRGPIAERDAGVFVAVGHRRIGHAHERMRRARRHAGNQLRQVARRRPALRRAARLRRRRTPDSRPHARADLRIRANYRA